MRESSKAVMEGNNISCAICVCDYGAYASEVRSFLCIFTFAGKCHSCFANDCAN